MHAATRLALGMGSARTPWYAGNSELAQSLVDFWPLDEASGDRTGVKGTVLTDNNTVTSAAGIAYPLAAEFVASNSESLSAADSAALSAGNIDMWFACWLRPAAVDVSATVIGKFNTSAHREWQIAQVNTSLVLQVSPDGTGTGNGAVTFANALTAGEWTFVMGYHDATNDLIGISANGSGFATSAHTTGIFDSAASFRVGGQGAGTAFFSGRIQSVAIGKNYVPSAADASFLYNKRPDGVSNVRYVTLGGEVDWHPNADRLIFDRRDDDDIYQIFTIDTDGRNETCLTVPAASGGPAAGLHKGWPSFHPSGEYIVCQAERSDSPDTTGLAEPGRGWWNNVWVCTADGSQWWQLTDYAAADNAGVLVPRFSPDGTKLLWSKKIGAVDEESAPLAEWNMQIADFAIVDGTPTISNVSDLTPGDKTFYEAHGFNRDSDRILYASDPDDGNQFGFDIFSADLDGNNATNLTGSDAQWDEHATFAIHADKIAFMSSKSYPAYTATSIAGLLAETWIMNGDGTNKRPVTHFNAPGFTEYNSEFSVATSCAWNPSGTQLAVVQMMMGDSFDELEGRHIWIVSFRGAV